MPEHPAAGTGQAYLDIEKMKLGDVGSFHRLYQLFHGDFVLKASSLLIENEKEEANNLVNQVFIKCWLRSDALTSMDYILAFLNTTVRNNCYACNNSKGFRSVHYTNILDTVLSDFIRNGFTRRELFARINILTQDELSNAKGAFSLFYGRRLSVTEIAKELGFELEYALNSLNLAFQVLHLILSSENM